MQKHFQLLRDPTGRNKARRSIKATLTHTVRPLYRNTNPRQAATDLIGWIEGDYDSF